MTRKILVATVAIAAGGALVSSVGSSAQEPQERSFKITDSRNGAEFAFVDNAPRTRLTRDGDPRRVSIGDEIVLVNRLTSSSGGRGRGYFHCTAVVASRGESAGNALCTYDLTLPDGHLTGSGKTNIFGNRIELPVNGGTGAYAGARGVLVRIEGPESMHGGTVTVTLNP